MLTRFEIEMSEEVEDHRAPAIINQVLSAGRIRELIAAPRGEPLGGGSTSDVYPVHSRLTAEEIIGLSAKLRRPFSPSGELVLKVAQRGLSPGYNYDRLVSDHFMITRPEIQPFAVACSHTFRDRDRLAMFEERAYGLNAWEPADLLRFSTEDFDRTIYQLLLVCEFFYQYNVSPNDIGKEFFYARDLTPPRILLFDLAFIDQVAQSGDSRVFKLLVDQGEIAYNIENIFMFAAKAGIASHKTTAAQGVLSTIRQSDYFHSFTQMAEAIDTRYGRKFSGEYTQITGRQPISNSEAVKFTEAEFEAELTSRQETDKKAKIHAPVSIAPRPDFSRNAFRDGTPQKYLEVFLSQGITHWTIGEILDFLRKKVGDEMVLTWAIPRADGKGGYISLGSVIDDLEEAGRIVVLRNYYDDYCLKFIAYHRMGDMLSRNFFRGYSRPSRAEIKKRVLENATYLNQASSGKDYYWSSAVADNGALIDKVLDILEGF